MDHIVTHLFSRKINGTRSNNRIYQEPFGNGFDRSRIVDESLVAHRMLVKGFKCGVREIFNEEAPISMELIPGHQNKVSIGNEEGVVTLFEEKASGISWENTFQWKAHENCCVFSSCWMNENYFVTGSSDRSALLWDINALSSGKSEPAQKLPHCSTVKWLQPIGNKGNEFLSGIREGSVFHWDIRTNSEPVRKWTVSRDRRKASSVDGLVVTPDSQVFAVSSQGKLTMWDMRSSAKPLHDIIEVPNRGLSTLTIDSSGAYIAANHVKGKPLVCRWLVADVDSSSNIQTLCCDDKTSTYNCDSFYIGSSFSPCGTFLASGSSDGVIYIWDLTYPQKAPTMLPKVHAGEVSLVKWDPINFGRLTSLSDDMLVSWRIDIDEVNKQREVTSQVTLASKTPLYLMPRSRRVSLEAAEGEDINSDSDYKENYTPNKGNRKRTLDFYFNNKGKQSKNKH